MFLIAADWFSAIIVSDAFCSRFLRIVVHGSAVCNIFFITFFIYGIYYSCSRSNTCGTKLFPGFTWRFIICLRIYRFCDLIYRYICLTKAKLFIRYFLPVRNFAKKFNSSSFGSCLFIVKFFISFFLENVLAFSLKQELMYFHQPFAEEWAFLCF